jgi:hypothetical protein
MSVTMSNSIGILASHCTSVLGLGLGLGLGLWGDDQDPFQGRLCCTRERQLCRWTSSASGLEIGLQIDLVQRNHHNKVSWLASIMCCINSTTITNVLGMMVSYDKS